MPRSKVRKAVKVRKAQPDCGGCKVKTKRHLNFNAPVGDFSPVKPKNRK